MADNSLQQRLAAVLAADVVGYTRLMEEDTEGTVAAWQAVRDGVINPTVSDHSGRIVKLTGDGFLAEFPTVHEAVNCGIAMQEGFADSVLQFRIGINLGAPLKITCCATVCQYQLTMKPFDQNFCVYHASAGSFFPQSQLQTDSSNKTHGEPAMARRSN